MGKSVADAVLDAALAVVKTATRMDVCSDVGTPSDLTGSLANVAMVPASDYTIADGDSSGRKITTAQKAGVSVTGNGTAHHIVLSLTGTILLVTTCTAQVLTSGNTVTIPAFKEEIADPT
jgi:hypothetical protein